MESNNEFVVFKTHTSINEGFHKWGYPQLAGWFQENPILEMDGWDWLMGSPILGAPQMDIESSPWPGALEGPGCVARRQSQLRAANPGIRGVQGDTDDAHWTVTWNLVVKGSGVYHFQETFISPKNTNYIYICK